jgi:tripartite-type tricarboxylate transporter receptor subunit TctC
MGKTFGVFMRINSLLRLTLIFCVSILNQNIKAQTNYPNKPVKMIVAAATGGGTDILGRMFAQKLSEKFGQPFVVDNKGGGGGSVAADFVAKSPNDGYTLLVTNDQLTVGASFNTNLNFDVLKDFSPIGIFGRSPLVVGVNPSVNVNNVDELIALVKANPKKYSFSSCGYGTPLHLAGELLNITANIDMVHVPYKGCAPALTDVVSGQIPIFFNMMNNVSPFAKSGKVKLLAVASSKRLANLPNLPTIAESGFPNFDAFPWFGMLAPAGTPKNIVSQLSAEIQGLVESKDISEKLKNLSFEPTPTTPEAFTEIMKSDLVRWRRVVKEGNLKAIAE